MGKKISKVTSQAEKYEIADWESILSDMESFQKQKNKIIRAVISHIFLNSGKNHINHEKGRTRKAAERKNTNY